MPSHAVNKERRRQDILQAAKDLIRESETGDFSMLDLAARAGVSLATPYNLLGSKFGILTEIHERELQDFREKIGQFQFKDPVDAVLTSADEAMKEFLTDEKYYKFLVQRSNMEPTSTFSEWSHDRRDEFWTSLLDRVMPATALRPGLDRDVAARFLATVYRSVILNWSANRHTSEDIRAWMAYSMALAMAGFTTDPHSSKAAALAVEHQKQVMRRVPDRKPKAASSAEAAAARKRRAVGS